MQWILDQLNLGIITSMLAITVLNNIQLENNISMNTVLKNTSLRRSTCPACLASKNFYLLSQSYNYNKKTPIFCFKASRNSAVKQAVLVEKSVIVRSRISFLFCSCSYCLNLLLLSQLSPALAVCLMQSVVWGTAHQKCAAGGWTLQQAAWPKWTSSQTLAQRNMAQGVLLEVFAVRWYWSPSPFTHFYSYVISKLSKIWHKISDINLHFLLYTHHRLDYCNLVIIRIALKFNGKLLWLQEVASPSLFRQVCMNQTCTLFGQLQVLCFTNALKLKR